MKLIKTISQISNTIQKSVIFLLFLLNFGSFIYVRLFSASYDNMLKLNNVLFDITLAGILIFLLINLYSIMFIHFEKFKWIIVFKVMVLLVFMGFITVALFLRNGYFAYIMRFLGTVIFFKKTLIHMLFILITTIVLSLIIWVIYDFDFKYIPFVVYVSGFILLLYYAFFFMGIASYTAHIPWLSQKNEADCYENRSKTKIPVLFKNTTLTGSNFRIIYKYNEGYDDDCCKNYKSFEFASNGNVYEKTVSNINILTGLFMFFIIIIAGYKVRIEFYLAILASLMALASSSLFAFYYTESVINNFHLLNKVIILNDFYLITSIILPATILLRDKTFLNLLKYDIFAYFLAVLLLIFIPAETGYFMVTATDIVFMGLGFIFLYKYHKTANENPELIEKNRFLKEYMD